MANKFLLGSAAMTKEELKKHLKEKCDRLNEEMGEMSMRIEFCVDENCMRIDALNADGSYIKSSKMFKFDPPLEPPKKGSLVYVVNSLNSYYLEPSVSQGSFGKVGGLMCYRGDGMESTFGHTSWYDPATGNHTPDFPVDRIPEELRFGGGY